MNTIAMWIGYATMISTFFVILYGVMMYRRESKDVNEEMRDEELETMSDEEWGELTIDQLVN